MRRADHKGPAPADRLDLAATRGEPVTLTLKAGRSLAAAVAEAMAAAGADSAWLMVRDAPVERLTFVIPAKAPTSETVAWYSAPYVFETGGRVERLGMIVGQHNGASFLHGHGQWQEEGAAMQMGHILADDTVLAKDCTATGFVLADARFDRLADPETNFDLFQPTHDAGTDKGAFALLRIRPNIDFLQALGEACARLGWGQARVHGLGSLIEARFEDGTALESFETEFLVEDGVCYPQPGKTWAEISIVGRKAGLIMQGRLAAAENPVLITAEIVLERQDGA